MTRSCMWFFLFKEKTAYEMRISDWSADVCASDLVRGRKIGLALAGQAEPARGAVDQPHPQPVFDPGKPAADSRGRKSEFQGGLRQAVALCDHREEPHVALAAHVISIRSSNAIMK